MDGLLNQGVTNGSSHHLFVPCRIRRRRVRCQDYVQDKFTDARRLCSIFAIRRAKILASRSDWI